MTTPASRAVRELARALDRRDLDTADVHRTRVTGRAEDGRLLLTRLDGTCQVGGEVGPEAVGDVITTQRGPLYDPGTAGVALAALTADEDGLWLERLEPDVFAPGETYTVTVVGRGFSESTRVDLLREPGSSTLHPHITMTELRYLDSETLEIDIQVDAGAQPIERAPVAYGDV